MTKTEIIKRLEKELDPELYRHSIAVHEMSVKLAELYEADVEKASLAGLLHDCARKLSNRELLQYAEHYNVPPDQIQLDQPILLHAPVGAKLAQFSFGIDDYDILHAIEAHCTGSTGMSKLDGILFVADAAEANRDYPGVQGIRKLAFGGNLDTALLEAMELKIIYVIEKRLILHPLSVEARNEILNKIKLG